LQVLNAILYVAEHGCKWHGLHKRFGNWHTVYMRMKPLGQTRSPRLAKAHAGKKDVETATDYYRKVANANTLPDLQYALVRKQAKKALGK
jgi:transposase